MGLLLLDLGNSGLQQPVHTNEQMKILVIYFKRNGFSVGWASEKNIYFGFNLQFNVLNSNKS